MLGFDLHVQSLGHVLHIQLVLRLGALLVSSDEPICPGCILENLWKQLAVLGLAESYLLLGQHIEGHHANFYYSVGCFLLVLVLAKLLQLLTH